MDWWDSYGDLLQLYPLKQWLVIFEPTETTELKKVMADFNAFTNWHGTYVKVER